MHRSIMAPCPRHCSSLWNSSSSSIVTGRRGGGVSVAPWSRSQRSPGEITKWFSIAFTPRLSIQDRQGQQGGVGRLLINFIQSHLQLIRLSRRHTPWSNVGLRALLKGPKQLCRSLSWPHQESNHRPHGSKSSRLTTTLQPAPKHPLKDVLKDAQNWNYIVFTSPECHLSTQIISLRR